MSEHPENEYTVITYNSVSSTDCVLSCSDAAVKIRQLQQAAGQSNIVACVTQTNILMLTCTHCRGLQAAQQQLSACPRKVPRVLLLGSDGLCGVDCSQLVGRKQTLWNAAISVAVVDISSNAVCHQQLVGRNMEKVQNNIACSWNWRAAALMALFKRATAN